MVPVGTPGKFIASPGGGALIWLQDRVLQIDSGSIWRFRFAQSASPGDVSCH